MTFSRHKNIVINRLDCTWQQKTWSWPADKVTQSNLHEIRNNANEQLCSFSEVTMKAARKIQFDCITLSEDYVHSDSDQSRSSAKRWCSYSAQSWSKPLTVTMHV